jgi:alpha-ribazole phosphatase/probable phosphoglycerate mutase
LPELRERNFGIWEGMSFDEIKEKYPEEFNSWVNNPLKFSPMEGESTVKVKDRAIKIFNEIIEKNSGQTIAIVSHGGINRILLCELLGIPLENIFRIEQDYGCLNVVELWDNYPVVKLINGRIE